MRSSAGDMIVLVTQVCRLEPVPVGELLVSAASKTFLETCFGFGDVFGVPAAEPTFIIPPWRRSRYDLEITLEEAANGMTAQLRIPRLESCETAKDRAPPPNRTGNLQHVWWRGQMRYQQVSFRSPVPATPVAESADY